MAVRTFLLRGWALPCGHDARPSEYGANVRCYCIGRYGVLNPDRFKTVYECLECGATFTEADWV